MFTFLALLIIGEGLLILIYTMILEIVWLVLDY